MWLVNGSPSENFKMDRGLRQGDPLSPFLFLITAEGISVMMNKVVDEGLFKPLEVGRDKIKISHLQFADVLCSLERLVRETFYS